MSDNQEKLQAFLSTTATTDYAKALEMLELTNWKLDEAIMLHFSIDDTPDPPKENDVMGPSVSSTSASTSSSASASTTMPNRQMGRLGLESLEPSGPSPASKNKNSNTKRSKKSALHSSSSSSMETLPKSSKSGEKSSASTVKKGSRFEFIINIKNKHDRRVWEKSYRLDTLRWGIFWSKIRIFWSKN